MPEVSKEDDKCKIKPNTADEKTSESDDQKRREYYYDDAHGYENFIDDEEDVDSEDEASNPTSSDVRSP